MDDVLPVLILVGSFLALLLAASAMTAGLLFLSSRLISALPEIFAGVKDADRITMRGAAWALLSDPPAKTEDSGRQARDQQKPKESQKTTGGMGGANA